VSFFALLSKFLTIPVVCAAKASDDEATAATIAAGTTKRFMVGILETTGGLSVPTVLTAAVLARRVAGGVAIRRRVSACARDSSFASLRTLVKDK
jgi:hypothetical protein